MNTLEPRSLDCSVRLLSSRRRLLPSLLGLPLVTGIAAAQELDLKMSLDGATWTQSAIVSPPHNYLVLRCETAASEAGGWIAPFGDVSIEGLTGAEEPEVLAFAEEIIDFPGVAAPYLVTCFGPDEDFYGRVEDLQALLHRLLCHTDAPNPPEELFHLSPLAVTATADPLFVPSPVGPIDQLFGTVPVPDWPLHGGSKIVNLDGALQKAAWRRAAPFFAHPREFFDGPSWPALLKDYQVNFRITLIGLRDSALLPGQGAPSGQTPPDLGQYPIDPPNIKLSKTGLITFVGTSLTWLAGLEFVPHWTGVPIPIALVPAGQVCVREASGFMPGMEIELASTNLTPRVVYTVPLFWANFGRVRFRVPHVAAPGNYDVERFRYRNADGTFGEWQTIPETMRPTIGVY